MMKAVPEPRSASTLRLRAIMSAGEAVGDAVFAWCRDRLGVVPNEMFGQTEINYIVGNCAARWPARAGSMGRPYPGHRVAVIDDDGHECPRGTPGDVALHRATATAIPTRCSSSAYWKRDDATTSKFTGDPDDSWCRTGDTAVMDEAGYLWYQGRSDDVFKAAGYRIGPSEIENCLREASRGGQCRGGAQARYRARRAWSRPRRARAGTPGRRARWSRSCRRTSAASSRPTNTRRRSSSSTPCR
jgi:acetyl-CoA synthetase